jgi:hypothetical protein
VFAIFDQAIGTSKIFKFSCITLVFLKRAKFKMRRDFKVIFEFVLCLSVSQELSIDDDSNKLRVIHYSIQ